MTKLDRSHKRVRISIRAFIAAAATLLIVLVPPAGVASAHTSFEQSSPADGATISEPLGSITLQFSGETEYGDDGFTVLTPDGMVRTPDSVSSSDQKVFELTFDPPLAGGEIGMRWKVNAPDAHTIIGSFSFTVTALNAAGTAAGNVAAASGADPMAADGVPASELSGVLQRLNLTSLASPGEYKQLASDAGLEFVEFEDLSEMLPIHYGRVREETHNNIDELLKTASQEYLDAMMTGLQHWVDAGNRGLLSWGIFHFRKL